jgi:UDP-N-acetylmuramyl pentapeptide phosphotransferase/UDP-N-acetylglucosamine-1-phosphate transferase
VEVSPLKRILFEFISVTFIVMIANIRVESMHGLFGIYKLPYAVSVIFSIVGITFVTNAYNLIDGVDGLSGGLGLIGMLFLGTYFLAIHNTGAAVFAFCMAGSLLGFLKYNITPAKIFMGDNGALILGFSITALCILFSERPVPIQGNPLADLNPNGKLSIVIAIISIPIFDTFRVFALRIKDKKSPFAPDRRHLHHALLDLGLKSTIVSLTLHVLTVFFIFLAILMQNLNPTISISVIGMVCLGFTYFITKLKERKLMGDNETITMIPINTIKLVDANILREEDSHIISN